MRDEAAPAATRGLGGWWRGALLAIGIGAMIGALVQLGSGRFEPLDLGLGAAIGLLIFLFASGLLAATARPRARLAGASHGAALTAIFLISGVAAWLTVWAVFTTLTGRGAGMSKSAFWISIGVTAGLAVLIGFTAYAYERLRRDLSEKISRLKSAEFAERELELARAMQRRLLPPLRIDAGSYRLAARNRPATWVAGDFYEVFTHADGRQGIALGDVAGKGMATSLIMASVKAMLPLLAANRSAADTLTALNQRLIEDLGSREFVAAAYAVYDPATGALELANAGLPDPYLLVAAGPVRPIGVSGQRLPLGVRQDATYESVRLALEPGDRVLLLTDGLPEAQIDGDEPLGYEAFERLLPRLSGDPDALLERLFRAVGVRAHGEPSDDWTALVLERATVSGG